MSTNSHLILQSSRSQVTRHGKAALNSQRLPYDAFELDTELFTGATGREKLVVPPLVGHRHSRLSHPGALTLQDVITSDTALVPTRG